ncbi:MAG TPA: GNAT family N-acetyltransferase [Solirubrobacteraceae bacterium]|jgi:phosphinothricin acetyltransferase|nr:GNAT family N-acetyltransferase [Solirubrobacteraceae bacterium]
MLIRHAQPDANTDGAACAAIYAPFVQHTGVSFEDTPPDAAEFARRIERLAATHAFLVAEDERGVAGFAYGAPHRERAAYRWATEVSVYIDERAQRRGFGRALYGQLLPMLGRQGMWTALAGVALPNAASVALHEACGFEPIGVYHKIGFKLGRWFDVGWWELALQHGPGPPAG